VFVWKDKDFCFRKQNLLLSAVEAGDAGAAAAFSSKNFWDKIGRIWAQLRQNLGKIEAKFGKK